MGETVYCDGSCRTRDELQERADAIYEGDRAEEINQATTSTTPEAAAIVARHKLPRGAYGIGTPSGSVNHVGSAFDAVAKALATGEETRLYRNAFGWRLVGIVHADGRFTDERKS
jgi:hypothetical protein